MRTKTLLSAVAALAVGVATSMAQTTYSQNVVGYVNLTLTNGGYTLIANQMDLDGTGTNNTVNTTIGTNLPANSKVYCFDPALPGFRNITLSAGHVWSSGVAGPYVQKALQPGGGVMVYIPGTGGTTTNITLVGTVLQQTNITTFPSQYQFAAYPFPVAGYVTTNFNYVPNPKNGTVYDQIVQWSVPSQGWVTHKFSGTSWTGGSPNAAVGEAFFLIPNQTTTWTNGFKVQ